MIWGIVVLVERWFITRGHAKFERPFVYLHEAVLADSCIKWSLSQEKYHSGYLDLMMLDLMMLVYDVENMKMNDVGVL